MTSSTNKLFSWRSEALREWAKGYIIVMAETPEEARKKALEYYDAMVTAQHSLPLEEIKADEYYGEKYREFEQDLQGEASTGDTLLIWGSA